MADRLRPLGDRVVVKLDEAPKASKMGILLPDGAKTEVPRSGSVVAVGAGRLLDNGDRGYMELNVGDRVYLGQYGGVPVEIDGEKLLMVDQGSCFAVIESVPEPVVPLPEVEAVAEPTPDPAEAGEPKKDAAGDYVF